MGCWATPCEPLVIFVRMDGQGRTGQSPRGQHGPRPVEPLRRRGMSPRKWQTNSPADQQELRSQCAWLTNDLARASGQRRSQVEWRPGRQTMGGSDGRVHFSQFMDA